MNRPNPLPLVAPTHATTPTRRLALGSRLAGWPPEALALMLLMMAVSTDRLGIRVSDYLNLRVELIVGSGLVLWAAWRARATWRAVVGPVEGCLLGWLAVGTFASLVVAPNRGEALKFTVMMAGLLLLYWAARLLMQTSVALTAAALAWVIVGSIVSGAGLVAALAYRLFGLTAGISFNRLYHDGVFSAVPMVYSTMWEPNLFGSYALTVGALALLLGRAPAFASPQWQAVLRVATACAFGGVVVSLTRTVWVAAAGLLLILCIMGLRRGLFIRRTLLGALLVPVLAGGGLGLLLGQAMPTASWRTDTPWAYSYEQIAQQASDIVAGRQPSLAATPVPNTPPTLPDPNAPPAPTVRQSSALWDRLVELLALNHVPTYVLREQVAVNAFAGWQQRPLLGWGFNNYRYVYPPAPRAAYWIGNLELHLLFDTGLVGLLLFAGAVGLAAWRGGRALRLPRAQWTTAHYILAGGLLAGLGLGFTYQLTEGTGLGFTWLLFALIVAAGEIARRVSAAGLPIAPLHS